MSSAALGQALLDVQDRLDVCLSIHVSKVGSIALCGNSLKKFFVADEELLKKLASDAASVLDIGSGPGTRLQLMASSNPDLKTAGVESYEPARNYTVAKLPNAEIFRTLDQIPAGNRYDLILVMAQYLGLAGGEQKAREILHCLVGKLAPAGVLIVEVGNPLSGAPFQDNGMTLTYGDYQDEIAAGWFGRDWMVEELKACGLCVKESRYFTTMTRFYKATFPDMQEQ